MPWKDMIERLLKSGGDVSVTLAGGEAVTISRVTEAQLGVVICVDSSGSEVVLGTDHIAMARALQKTARLPVTPAFVSPKADPKP